MRVSPLRKFVAVHTFHTGVPKMRHGPQNKSRKMGIGWVRKITWKTQEKNKNQGNKKNTLLSFWVNYVLQGFRDIYWGCFQKVLFLEELNTEQNFPSALCVRDIYDPLWLIIWPLTLPKIWWVAGWPLPHCRCWSTAALRSFQFSIMSSAAVCYFVIVCHWGSVFWFCLLMSFVLHPKVTPKPSSFPSKPPVIHVLISWIIWATGEYKGCFPSTATRRPKKSWFHCPGPSGTSSCHGTCRAEVIGIRP